MADAGLAQQRVSAGYIAAVVGTQLLAWAILGLGLIAPLTPSEGPPAWSTVAIWLGIPLLLLAWTATRVRSVVARIVCGLEIGLMIYATWRLALAGW